MTSDSASRLKRNAYVSIVLFGIVSLMGDIVYEGSRGAVPEYLALLGATGFVVVFVGESETSWDTQCD